MQVDRLLRFPDIARSWYLILATACVFDKHCTRTPTLVGAETEPCSRYEGRTKSRVHRSSPRPEPEPQKTYTARGSRPSPPPVQAQPSAAAASSDASIASPAPPKYRSSSAYGFGTVGVGDGLKHPPKYRSSSAAARRPTAGFGCCCSSSSFSTPNACSGADGARRSRGEPRWA